MSPTHGLFRASTPRTLLARLMRPLSLDGPRFSVPPRRALRLRAEPAHRLQDALLADEDALTAQLSVDPAVAVPPFMPLEAFLHELLEGLALYLGVRFSSPQVLVVARF